MPPVSKKNISVILFDLAMCRNTALDILKCISTHLTLNKLNDQMQLVLLNSTTMKNSRDFSNIRVIGNSARPYNTALLVNTIKDLPSATGTDWLQGIEVAADILEEHLEEKNVFNLQLFFITDLQNCSLDGSADVVHKQLEDISATLDSMILYIIGVDVQSPVTIKTKTDIISFMEQCTYKLDNTNYQVAKRLCMACAGVMCNLETGLDLIAFYTKPIPKQAWMVPLTLGGFEFPTLTSRMIASDNISMKNSGENTRSVEYNIPAETEMDEAVPIHKDDTVKAYSFLGKHFTLPDDVNQSFKYIGERCFNCIGFVNQDEIPELYLGGEEVHSVTGHPNNEKSEAFNRLVAVSHQKKMYGLAYRSYNKNNAPRLYILVPAPPGQFYMVPHPEIVKQLVYPIENSIKEEPKIENTKMVDLCNDFLMMISKNPLTIHPHASNQIHYKNAISKIGNLLAKQSNDDEMDTNNDDPDDVNMGLDDKSNGFNETPLVFKNKEFDDETKAVLKNIENLMGAF